MAFLENLNFKRTVVVMKNPSYFYDKYIVLSNSQRNLKRTLDMRQPVDKKKPVQILFKNT